MEPLLWAQDLAFSYAKQPVLQSLSLQLGPGQILALLGPNGAGKTTFQRLIRGRLRPSSGRLLVLGQDPVAAPASWRAQLAWVHDLPAVHQRLTVVETLRFYAGLYQRPFSRCLEALEQVGLQGREKHLASQLSRGQQQRLAWARALLTDPKLILLDEPTNGLDVEARYRVQSLIAQQRQLGRGILLSTHDFWEAQELADHIGILAQGRLLALGSSQDLRQQYLPDGPERDSASWLEKVYQVLTGRSLYPADECPA